MSRRTTGGSHVPARHVSTCHVRARLSAKRGLVVLCALFLFHASASIAARAQGGSSGATGAGRPGAGERGSASPGAQGSIKGRVVDDAGQPLAYAFVTLNTRASFPATPRSMQSTTDEEGNFNFDGLDAGAYHLVAHVAGYVPAREPGADSFADADTYRVGDTATLRLFKGSVITGTVTDADGAPVVAARMRVVRVRELDGTQARVFGYGREFLTDDRGVYRLYGLRPGAYLVVAGGPAQWTGGLPTSTDSDAPTYFPSGPRDTATEVTVRAGQEATGVDIRYRGERGFVVSGRVEGAGESSVVDGGMQLVISHAASGALLGSLWFPPREWEGGFAFDGIADGEYELRARRMTPGDAGGPGSASKPVRVQVRGADVEGVRVVLAPLAALKGRILLAPLAPAERERAACEGTALGVQESLVYARRDEPGEPSGVARMLATSRAEGTPTAEGDFFLRGLDPGRYRVSARPLSEDWFLRSVTSGETPRAAEAMRNADSVALVAGQTHAGMTVTLAEGAASLRGRVVQATSTEDDDNDAASASSTRLRVFIVPVASERSTDAAPRGRGDGDDADNALRYAEASVGDDGSFVFTNLAPRSYLLIALPRDPQADPKPLAWDAAARARLRREAESSGQKVELRPCQRVSGYTLKLASPPEAK